MAEPGGFTGGVKTIAVRFNTAQRGLATAILRPIRYRLAGDASALRLFESTFWLAPFFPDSSRCRTRVGAVMVVRKQRYDA